MNSSLGNSSSDSLAGRPSRISLRMGFPSPSNVGGFEEDLTDGRDLLAIKAPCAARSCLILQGTVTVRRGGNMLDETVQHYSFPPHIDMKLRIWRGSG